MKTSVITLSAVIASCSALFAQPAVKSLDAKPALLSNQAVRSNMLAKTGGMVQLPVEGPEILFLNTQTKVRKEALGEVTEALGKLRLPITLTSNPSDKPVDEAIKALPNNAAVIVIGDSAGYPSLLIAPENRWAMVNVAALNGDGVSQELLTTRVQKELWRAFGYLMGAANSNYEHCLLKPVFSLSDIDELKVKSLCPEPFNKIMSQAQKMGIKPIRMTTYRKAVEEGWAPKPVNDIQNAIWTELKK